MSCGNFLCRQRDPCLPLDSLPPEDAKCPSRNFQPGRLADQREQRCGYNIPVVSDSGQALGVSIQATYYGGGYMLPGAPEGEGLMNRVRSGPDGIFTGSTTPVSVCYW